MGVKKTLPSFKLFDDQTVNQFQTVQSAPTNITNLDNISIQFKWNCSVLGNAADYLKVLVSNDNIDYYDLGVPNMPNFANETQFGLILNLNQISQPWIKLEFYSNGTGYAIINATIFGKDLN
jgi:hypothetical protein